MTMQTAPDPRTLLPHFTTLLSMQLADRLQRSIREQGVPRLNGGPETPFVHAWRRTLAEDLTARIYLTQIRDAKRVLSFAESLLKYAGVPDLDNYDPGAVLLSRRMAEGPKLTEPFTPGGLAE